MGIMPIETAYKGYRFRSRLEARWAVFFDALGFDWQYEPEGFKCHWPVYDEQGDATGTKEAKWLPDFYLSEPRVFVEVKGTWKDVPENYWRMLLWMLDWSGPLANEESALLFLGNIPDPSSARRGRRPGFPIAYWSKGVWTDPAWFVWTELLFSRDCSGEYHDASCGDWESFANNILSLFGIYVDNKEPSDTLQQALLAARSARFEFGEKP